MSLAVASFCVDSITKVPLLWLSVLKMETALRLHQRMVKKGILVTTATFNALLVGLKYKWSSKVVSQKVRLLMWLDTLVL